MAPLDPSDARLVDRDSERQLIDQLLADARSGRSGVLVVRGEAGIGKTALLLYAGRRSSGFRVEQIAAVQAEMELPFAGLQQLLAPMLDRLPAIPGPQRSALQVALGLAPGTPPDRFLLSLAVLSLVAAVAEERPLLCVVDDAQWLDVSSAQVLAFVARRLAAEPVACIFGVRDPAEARHFDDLRRLRLEGLLQDDARDLLVAAVGGPLDERVRDRIIAESRGNPLALLEIPRGMTAAEIAGGFEVALRGDLPSHLEALYSQRSAGLPPATRRLLLVAAADPTGDPPLVWRAAGALGVGGESLAPAAEAGLLEIGTAVRFPHPLVRSALYRSAPAEERRAVHAALADATDQNVDGDRHAWHRAAAVIGPDEDVAAELESCADRARARGGVAASAAFLRRAVALTPEPHQRAARAVAAAQVSMQAGAFESAGAMLAAAETARLDPETSAQVAFVRGQVAFAAGRTSDAAPLLLSAAQRLVPFDLERARAAYLTGLGAAMWGGRAHADALLAACHEVLALRRPAGTLSATDALLEGMATLIARGHAAAAPLLRHAAGAFSGPDASVDDALRWGWFSTATSNALWDDEGLRAVCARQLEIVRETGALAGAQTHLTALGTLAVRSGDFAQCEALLAELAAMAEATGAQVAPYNDMLLLAHRGRAADALAVLHATLDQGDELQQGLAVTVAQWAASILYNGLGQFDDAREAAAAAAATPHEAFAAVWSLPELVEAAVRTGKPDCARAAAERLIVTTQAAGTDFGLGIEARCRALVSTGDEADGQYRLAIDRLCRTRMRADLSRAHLLYGEWLRATGRGAASREHLLTAHESFTAMGLEAFAERARRELLALGEAVQPAAPAADRILTPQERQIALLARDGLRNPEIAARLFLSPRTVEWHLGRVFDKLGIRSRRRLGDALGRRAAEPGGADPAD